MSEPRSIFAKRWGEKGFDCECCGKVSKHVWGELSCADRVQAVYSLHWTVGAPDHLPNIDLILGPWGDGTKPSDRFLVAMTYRPQHGGGPVTIVDGDGRPANDSSICGKALARAEVIGRPIAEEVFELVDALWLTEPGVREMLTLDDLA